MTLGSVIAARIAEWGFDDLPLERDLFGSSDPDAIAGAVGELCRRLVGAGVARYEFFESSSGSVHGVTLTDGRRVVLKGHRAVVERVYLEAVADLQRDLAGSGYPAPLPLCAPSPAGAGHVTIEELLACPERADGHHPRVSAALAQGLARFVELSRHHVEAVGAVTQPMAVPAGQLYPQPHSARFDFVATAAGAEWIDALVRRARDVMRTIPPRAPVVAHGDWRLENVCVAGAAVRAVYDWDSVHVGPEPIAIAPAVTTFSVDWTRAAGVWFPSPREMAAFIAEYEQARGVAFDRDEQTLLAAAMVASLGYGARCEHADTHEPPTGDDSQRGLLARVGAGLLEDGLGALARS